VRGTPLLGQGTEDMRNWPPHSITTDKLGSYPKAIRRLEREGKLPQDTSTARRNI
jgi:IS6 family transposase